MSDVSKSNVGPDGCVLWVVDYRLDGRARQWFRALPPVLGAEAMRALMLEELEELYGPRAELLDLRPASLEERRAFLRGELSRPTSGTDRPDA
ncbi:hypothetical protein [Roseateles amylovorans]|uniref:Uncharacterized protein n=1 Tax=Roseateles amylovorans TaxID=2978473 RepID=A0ABY6B401_9BURK|nr:hypothetical protein [Roseateles amylovorans]UXH78694.1 hypothetical protein N4261_01770 [Roseateles amylovorans]